MTFLPEIEQESCLRIHEEFIEILSKYRASPIVAGAVALTIMGQCIQASYGLTDKQTDELEDLLSTSIQETAFFYVKGQKHGS